MSSIPNDNPLTESGAAAAPRSPLTPDQIEQLRQSQIAGKKIRRARRVALIDGWSIAMFAGVTLLCSVFEPFSAAFMLGAGMGIVAVIEFIGADRLRRLHPAAAKLLGFNQLAFASILIAYAAWSIHATLTSTTPALGAEYASIASQSPDAEQMIQSLDSLTRTITLGFYGAVILFAALVQGGTALYYFTRAAHVQAYLRQTPGWIVELQRAGLV